MHSAPASADKILPIMLKKGGKALESALLDTFNTCWIDGVYPQIWKREDRNYLQKADKPTYNSAKSYRSISLVSNMGKTYERIGSNRLYSFMEQNGLLSPFQYAYRKNRDLTQALLYYVLEAQQAIETNHYMLTTMVDLEGAYDCVWRAGLLKKLHNAGIRGRLYLFIQQYLTGRTVKSTVNSHTSHEFTTMLGLPQGGIVVVFLFIFYITDMTYRIPKKIGFADDLNAWVIHKDVLSAIRQTKTNCEELITWCKKWRMLINWGKTFFMLHQPRRQHKLHFSFKVGQHHMKQVHSARCQIMLTPFVPMHRKPSTR